MKYSSSNVTYLLRERYGFSEDRAERALEIASQYKKTSIPVPGGYVNIGYRFVQSSPLRFTIEEHTKKVASGAERDYTQGEKRPAYSRRETMPPRGRNRQQPEPEAIESNGQEEDYGKYLNKPLTATMQDYVEWFEDNVAPLADLDADRILTLGTTLYPKFQKSDFNIDRREARRAERAEAEPEPETAPARGRGRRAATEETPAKAPAKRGRPRAAAGAGTAAPY